MYTSMHSRTTVMALLAILSVLAVYSVCRSESAGKLLDVNLVTRVNASQLITTAAVARASACVRAGVGAGGHHERHEISCSEMADTKLMRVTMTMAKCSFISLDSTRSISISFCVPIEA